MKKKVIKVAVVLIVVVLCVVVYAAKEVQSSKTNMDPEGNSVQKSESSKETFTAPGASKYFLKLSDENKITRVEVFYMGLNILTRTAIDKERLQNDSWQYKAIVKNPEISVLTKSLREFDYSKSEIQLGDYRMGYVFYTGDKEALNLFFGNDISFVEINGFTFKTTPELIIAILPLLPYAAYQDAIVANKHNYKPNEGYVPDEKTAIQIALTVWIPIYGKKQIEGEKPYHAKLDNGIWAVDGSLPKGWVGGVAEAEIAKDDGRILRVSHGQ